MSMTSSMQAGQRKHIRFGRSDNRIELSQTVGSVVNGWSRAIPDLVVGSACARHIVEAPSCNKCMSEMQRTV